MAIIQLKRAFDLRGRVNIQLAGMNQEVLRGTRANVRAALEEIGRTGRLPRTFGARR